MLTIKNRKWVEYFSKLIKKDYNFTLNEIILGFNINTNKPNSLIINSEIIELYISNVNCKIDELEIFGMSSLKILRVGEFDINCIKITEKLDNLYLIGVSDSNLITIKNLYNLGNLEILDLHNNRVELLDLSKNINLKRLQIEQPRCKNSFLYELDISQNINLQYLFHNGNLIILR